MARRDLPFRLARQMLPGKAGEGIGFVVADVLHRSGRVDGSEAPQRHDMPGAVLLSPIAGCLPVFVLHRRAAVGRDEFEPLGVSYEMSCDPYAWNELVVKRRFVVETEALAIVADGMH